MPWPEVLDRLERRLEQQEAAAAAGRTVGAAFLPEVPLGPLPVELEGRARRLLDRTRALESGLARRRSQVVAGLAARVTAPTRPAAPRYVDRSA